MPTTRSLMKRTKAAVVHRVIDITPQPEPVRRRMPVTWPGLQPTGKLALAGGVGAACMALLTAVALHTGPARHAAAPAAGTAPRVAPLLAAAAPQLRHVAAESAQRQQTALSMSLTDAVQQGLVECSWMGNGKDRMTLDARNVSDQPLRLYLAAGQLLASVDSTVVIARSHTLEFAPHLNLREQFSTLATSSANRLGEAEFHLSSGPLPELDKLFAYMVAHPDASTGTIQTAALILTENLPLSSFARFNELSAGVALLPDTKDFKADTVEILNALNVLREIGVTRTLAVTVDPQLEIEAMIDPQAHAVALKYYGITNEWAYWKEQLLSGDPSTRHYALYGIARFYPDVALKMLPMWARQETMSPVYRLSAVQALAQTDKAEAIPILRGLENEFGGTSELGRAAHLAANYLDGQFARSTKVAAALTTTAERGPQGAGFASRGN